MNGKVYVLAWVVAGVGLSVAPARAADREDTRLGKRVEEQLRQDEKLRDYVLEAKVDDGVATLTGKVALDAARAHAEKVAQVPGVRSVDNQIEVAPLTVEERQAIQDQLTRQRAQMQTEASGTQAPQPGQPAGQPGLPAQQAVPAVAPAADEVPVPGQPDKDGFVHLQLPATPPGDPEKMVSGEAITTSWIDTRVMTELEGDEALKGSNVDVVTSDDFVVTLKGRVSSDAAKQRAVQIAKGTKGVREVDDQLRVAGRRSAGPTAP